MQHAGPAEPQLPPPPFTRYEGADAYRGTWLDAVAERLSAFLLRHGRVVGMVVLLGMTIGLVRPLLPTLATPLGAALTAAALVPIALAMALASRLDRTSKEPLELIVQTFLLGACLAVVAGILNEYLSYLPGPLKYLLVVGPGEEIVKLLAVVAVVYRHHEFDDAIDGLFYGIAAGAGFAAVENVIYALAVTNTAGVEAAWSTVLLRGVISAPGHAIWTGFAGYYLGIAKFTPARAPALVAKGLLVVAVVHGVYDILVTRLPVPANLAVGAAMHVAMAAWLVAKARTCYRHHGLLGRAAPVK